MTTLHPSPTETAAAQTPANPQPPPPPAKPTRRRARSNAPKPKPIAPARPNSTLRRIGVSVCLLATLLLGFGIYVYGLSNVQQERNQTTLFKSYRDKLTRGVAPVKPTSLGTPVALLDIPSLHIHQVVVEGTTAGAMTRGPGHRVSSPLPGEVGVSVIYGRRATFGASFKHLSDIRIGATITTTTGHGTATYKVTAAGDSTHPLTASAPNRLVLSTADSGGIPHHVITISADLQGATVVPDDGGYPALTADQQVLAGDSTALLPLMLWSFALLAVAGIGTLASIFWSRWPAYLVTIPVVLCVLWNIYENAAQLLPNVY